MAQLPREHKKQGIPFNSKDPQYHRVWELVNRRDKTLEEALEIVRTTPKKSYVRKPRSEKPAETPGKNISSEQSSSESKQANALENTRISDEELHRQLFQMPDELKHLALLEQLEQLKHLEKLPALEKYFDKITVHLSAIARNLDRICDHLEQHPNIVHVDTTHERIPERPAPPTTERTAGEFFEGAKVIMIKGNPNKAFGVGKVVRILPGKDRLKVQFTEEVRIATLDHFQLYQGGT